MNAHTKRDGRSAVASFGVAFHVFYSICGVVLRYIPFTNMPQ